MAAAATPRPHEFDEGWDGVERCLVCRVTRTRKGLVIPRSSICSPTTTLEVDENQYQTPIDALLADIHSSTLMPPTEPARSTLGSESPSGASG